MTKGRAMRPFCFARDRRLFLRDGIRGKTMESRVLVIRSEQIAAFRAAAATDFENRVVHHVRKHLPTACAAMTDSALRGLVRHGVERAGALVTTSQREVCKYIMLMLAFGRDFDETRPWARDVVAAYRG